MEADQARVKELRAAATAYRIAASMLVTQPWWVRRKRIARRLDSVADEMQAAASRLERKQRNLDESSTNDRRAAIS